MKKKGNKKTVSYKFLQEVPSKHDIHCKKGMYISFTFDWYSILLDHCPLFRTER